MFKNVWGKKPQEKVGKLGAAESALAQFGIVPDAYQRLRVNWQAFLATSPADRGSWEHFARSRWKAGNKASLTMH